MLKDIKQKLDAIRSAPRQEKIRLLRQHISDREFAKFIRDSLSFNSFRPLKADDIRNCREFEFCQFDDLFELEDYVRREEYMTDAKRLSAIASFVNMNQDCEDLVVSFFSKTLKLGISPAAVNAAVGGIAFGVPEAKELPGDLPEDPGSYWMQEKMSGFRMVAELSPDRRRYFRPDGKELPVLKKLDEALAEAYGKDLPDGETVYLDGVLTCLDGRGGYDPETAKAEMRRKEPHVFSPVYICVDMLRKDVFDGLARSLKYEDRYRALKKFAACGRPEIKVVFSVPYTPSYYSKIAGEYLERSLWGAAAFRRNSYFGCEDELLFSEYYRLADYPVKLIKCDFGRKEALSLNLDVDGATKEIDLSPYTAELRKKIFEKRNSLIGREASVKYHLDSMILLDII